MYNYSQERSKWGVCYENERFNNTGNNNTSKDENNSDTDDKKEDTTNKTPLLKSVSLRGITTSSTYFDIVQTFGTVSIKWRSTSIVMGNHKLEWQFDEFMDQEKMIDKINHDIEVYMTNVLQKYTWLWGCFLQSLAVQKN